MPPTGRTTPERDISPVIATRGRTGRSESKLTSAVTIANPPMAVFRNRSRGHVNVNILLAEKVRIDSIAIAMSAHPC